jgi:simple sugar transport system substrate-binding protein
MPQRTRARRGARRRPAASTLGGGRAPAPAHRALPRLARALRAAGPALLALLALAAGCERTRAAGKSTRAPGRGDVRIVVVTHGQPSDPFWSVVANGARDGARDMGVKVEYQAPTSFDMVAMSNLLDAAVATRPAGLVVSIPDPAALGRSIRAAVAAGIPVVSINSGADAYKRLGVLAHVGQTEYEAGRQAGERMAGAGVRRALCVNHEVGNASLDQRCAGFADALRKVGGAVEVLGVNLSDPEDTHQRIAGALRRDRALRGVLTLGPAAAEPALAALHGLGRADVAYATFDLTPPVLRALKDGRMLFAIDQQQYLQGYLPIVLLTKYRETGTMPGGGEVIRTGPGFVTRENAERVMDLATRGIR